MAAAGRRGESAGHVMADWFHRFVPRHAHHAHVRVRVPVSQMLRLEVEGGRRRCRMNLVECAEASEAVCGVGHGSAVVEPVVVLHVSRCRRTC